MGQIAPNTILAVLDSASVSYPPEASSKKIPKMTCVFPEAHSHGDQHPSAWLDGPGNVYGCQRCGTFTAKALALKLGVQWPPASHQPIAPQPAPTPPAKPAPPVDDVRKAVMVGIEHSSKVLIDDPAFHHLIERHLDESVRGKDPDGFLWPADGAGLPDCYAHLPRMGYRLAARLYDSHTGDLASIQARYVGPGDPPDGRKVRFPSGSGQSSGKVFANHAAVAWMRGTSAEPCRTVIVGEGLTDFLALAQTHRDIPVVATAGAQTVASCFLPPPHWLRPGMELISAMDNDEPGEVGAAKLVEACREAGAICRRIKFPSDSKDCCDIIKAWGEDALKTAVSKAAYPASITMFTGASRTLEEYHLTRVKEPESVLGKGLLRPRQFGIMYGLPGGGKTWAALDLAVAVAAGVDWFGIPVRQCRAGFLSLELERWDLTERLESILYARGLTHADLGDRLNLISPPDFDASIDLLNPDHALAVQAWIQENGLGFAVVDTLTKVHTADERDMRPVIEATWNIVRRTDSAILYLHHPRKSSPIATHGPSYFGTGMDDMRGDSRLRDQAKLVACMIRRRGVIELQVTKTNTGVVPPPIYLKPDDNGVLQMTELPRTKQEQAAETREKVLACLDGRTLKRSDLVTMTGLPEAHIKRALAALVKSESVSASGSTRDREFSIRTVPETSKSERPNQEGIEFKEDAPF